MSEVVKTKERFGQVLAESRDRLVVVYFYTSWSEPCQRMSSFYEQISSEYNDCVFIKINADDNSGVADMCDLYVIPTFQCYKYGSKVRHLEGAHEQILVSMINENR